MNDTPDKLPPELDADFAKLLRGIRQGMSEEPLYGWGTGCTEALSRIRHALETLFDMDQVLALSLRERASDADLTTEERAALAERDVARKTGDYTRSDELRAELARRYGIRLKDTKDGTRWERVRRKGA